MMYNPVFAPEALARKEKIQAAMRCMSADALLLTDNANLYYTSSRVFCGYTYIPVEGDMLYFVRHRSICRGIMLYTYVSPNRYPTN